MKMDLYYWLLNVWLANLSLVFCHLYFLNACSRPETVLNTQVTKEMKSQREFTKSRYWAHFMFTIDYMMKRIKYQLEWCQVWARATIVKHTLVSLQYSLNLEIWNGLFFLWTHNWHIPLEISVQLAGIQNRINQFI